MMTSPIHHQHNLNLTTVPQVMKRGEHVLILLIDENGHLVLGRKNLYPPNIYRMVGGGVEQGEAPHEAAQRELAEEIGINFKPEELVHLFSSTSTITSPEGDFTFTTHIFRAFVQSKDLKASSDLDGLIHLNSNEYAELIQRYRDLPITVDQELGFSWSDYGKLYGLLHDLAWQEYQARLPSAGPSVQ